MTEPKVKTDTIPPFTTVYQGDRQERGEQHMLDRMVGPDRVNRLNATIAEHKAALVESICMVVAAAALYEQSDLPNAAKPFEETYAGLMSLLCRNQDVDSVEAELDAALDALGFTKEPATT
jgi:hypothetical protein